MGGNHVAAYALRQFLRNEINVEVLTNMHKTDDKTLVVFLSYSGNTKEIISAFRKLKNKENALIVSSGGKLLQSAKRNKIKYIQIPENLHQRFTFAECFFPFWIKNLSPFL